MALLPGFDPGYGTITADCPWAESGGGKVKRGADRHYPLVPTKELPGLIRGSGQFLPSPRGCHLWLWVTDNFLTDGLWLMDQLGFRYIRTFQWVKLRGAVVLDPREVLPAVGGLKVPALVVARSALQIGLGQYGRGAHEMALLGVRGPTRLPRTALRHPSVLFATRTKHSRKPDEAIRLIEDTSPGPRLEMFAREPRPGWETWGNEVEEGQP